MSGNKGKWSALVEILFTYLAISKIMYWFGNITAMIQEDWATIGEVILVRMLNQDLMIIIGVILFFTLERLFSTKKLKYSKAKENILLHVVGYVILMAAYFLYFWIMSWVFGSPQAGFWGEFTVYMTILYVVIMVVLNIKQSFVNKAKKVAEDTPAANNEDEKLNMLEALHKGGLLTQEEFESKKKLLLGM